MTCKNGQAACRTDDKELERLLFDLVNIPSVNPYLSTDNEPDETQIIEYLCKKLVDYGFEVEKQEVEPLSSRACVPRRHNVIARITGNGNKTLALNGHIDTVTEANLQASFSPKNVDGKIFGRGASDMKGGIAAMIEGARAVKSSRVDLNGNIVLSLVIDEEATGGGTRKFLENEKPDYAIIGEPTRNEIGLAQAGYIQFDLECVGKIRHGSTLKMSDNSSAYVNSIRLMNRILDLPTVRKTRRFLDIEMPNTVNFYPLEQRVFRSLSWMTVDYYKAQVLIGVAPGKTVSESDMIIEDMVKELLCLIDKSNEAGQRNRVQNLFKNHGFIQPKDEFVNKFEQAANIAHGSPKHSYVLSFCDGTFFYDEGIPTLTYGPGKMELGHSDAEYVDLNEVKEAARTYAQAIVNILGTDKNS